MSIYVSLLPLRVSKQGMPLTVEAPESGYMLIKGNRQQIAITNKFITVDTEKSETVVLMKEK